MTSFTKLFLECKQVLAASFQSTILILKQTKFLQMLICIIQKSATSQRESITSCICIS